MLTISNKTLSPSKWEKIMNEAFILIKSELKIITEKAHTYDRIGRKELARLEFDKINMYHYIIFYCVLIAIYIEEQTSNGNSITYDDLEEKYSIECIINSAGCMGVKAMKIFDLFGFNNRFNNNPDGIEYFSVETGDNPFIIVGK